MLRRALRRTWTQARRRGASACGRRARDLPPAVRRVRDELRIDTGLAHPAGDQLGVLAPEVDDEDGRSSGDGAGERRDDVRIGGSVTATPA